MRKRGQSQTSDTSKLESLLSEPSVPSYATFPAATPLTTSSICLLAYFNICGGPWGSEEIVSSLGPAFGLLGVVFFALFWATPLALITSEMSSRFPYDGGYAVWVTVAFGPFAGFIESYWSFFSGVVDNAIYPVLCYEILSNSLGSLSIFEEALCKIILAVTFSLPVLLSGKSMTKYLGVLATTTLIPFIIFASYVFYTADNYSALTESKPVTTKGVMSLISILYWNFSGLDSTSTCAGNVRDPSYSYLRGLLLAILLTALTYIIPLAAGVLCDPDWPDWSEGSFGEVTEKAIGLRWLFLGTMFLGNLGMHCAELYEDAWQLAGMADLGMMPNFFASENKKPKNAAMTSVGIICCLVLLDFDSILGVCNFFSVASALLEIFSFVKVRLSEKKTYSGYQVPVHSITGLFLFLSIPCLLGGGIMLSSLFASPQTLLLNIAGTILGFALYFAMSPKYSPVSMEA